MPLLKKKFIVYVKRQMALGDVLWTEPLIRQLAKDYFKVVMLTPYYELFKNYPSKNVVFKNKLNKFDKYILEKWINAEGLITLDGTYEKNSKKHILEAYFEEAGYVGFPLSYPKLYLSEEEQKSPHSKPYALLHIDPGSITLNHRNAHGIEWNLIICYLLKKGLTPIFISNNNLGERYNAKTISPSIRQLISYINSCHLFIGLDSGPANIAAALNKKSVIFFGSVNPWFRHLKEYYNGIIFQKYCEFGGCYHDMTDIDMDVCRLAGRKGIPKCCHFTSSEVIEAIDSATSVEIRLKPD